MSINIHGKEYITVAERVKAIHDTEKNFKIETEVLSNEPVVIKATVTILHIGASGVSTGVDTAFAKVFTGISAANPNKAIEKMSPYEVAETSAVGRALGFAGYGLVDDIATADEMVKAGVKSDDLDIADMFNKPKGTSEDQYLKPATRDSRGRVYCSACGTMISKAVEKFSVSKYGKPLCMKCQDEGDRTAKDYADGEVQE